MPRQGQAAIMTIAGKQNGTHKMAKILLIRTFRELGAGGPVPPLGLLYIAAALHAASPKSEIRIFDTGIDSGLETLLASWKPDIAGISSLNCEAELFHSITGMAKRYGAAVWAGGPYPSTATDNVMADANVDLAILGEGEATAAELIAAFEKGGPYSGIAGLALRGPAGIYRTHARQFANDLDRIPRPAWDLLDFRRYGKYANWNGLCKRDFYLTVLTSRGCPFGCTFCHNLLGKKFRPRSARDVADEILALHEKFGAEEFHIIDDVFNCDKNRVLEISRLLLASGKKLDFAFPNGLRADILDEETVAAMRAMGTYKVNLAIESATPRLQEMTGKRMDIAKAEAAIATADRHGIQTAGYFMLGFPTETEAEMRATIDYAASSRFDSAYFFKVTAFPGSGLYSQVMDSGRQPGGIGDAACFQAKDASVADIDTATLNRFLLEAQTTFYLKPARLWRLLRKAPRPLAALRGLLQLMARLCAAAILLKTASPADSGNKH